MANKITTILDLDGRGFTKTTKSIRREIAETDGTFNKMKVGAKSTFAGFQQYGSEAAVAVGAALVAFGAKSVAAFNDTALAAGQMRDSLGVTAEEASRLIEVAEDLGIGTDTLERSIGIMNRTATNTPGHFAAIGAELVKNTDGTTNVNETFLSTIDALNKIPDASARAAAAQKVFGRSWMDMAELIGMGADQVRDALAAVEDGKIIDDKEVEQARRFRDALDALKGTVEELQIEIGGVLVPVLSDAAESLMTVKSAANDLVGIIPGPLKTAFKELGDQVQRSLQPWKYYTDVKDVLTDTTETVGTLGDSVKEFGATSGETADAYADHAAGMRRESQRLANKLTADWARITGRLTDEQAFLEVKSEFGELREAAVQAWEEGAAGAEAYRLKQLGTNQAIAAYLEQLGDIPAEKASEIIALIDAGSYNEAERKFNLLARRRAVQFDTYTPNIRGGVGAYGAEGGIVNRPTVALIGEAGPEAVVPLHKTPGNGPLPSGLGGGGNVYNSITINTGADPEAVVNAIKKYSRRNGPGSVPL